MHLGENFDREIGFLDSRVMRENLDKMVISEREVERSSGAITREMAIKLRLAKTGFSVFALCLESSTKV